jgi:histidinol-phosphate aminotransferase
VGYLVVPDGLAARFEASRLPLAVGGASDAAAVAALSDPGTARARLGEIVAQRERLASAFGELGWGVLPSLANFLLVKPPDAQAIAAMLLRQGLAVRSYPEGPLHDWLRITVRAQAENDRLLEALASAG